jgi:hypothetical protein
LEAFRKTSQNAELRHALWDVGTKPLILGNAYIFFENNLEIHNQTTVK